MQDLRALKKGSGVVEMMSKLVTVVIVIKFEADSLPTTLTSISLAHSMATSIPTGFRALPLPIVQLSLAAVLKCGQSFRWTVMPLALPSPTVNGPSDLSLANEYRLCLRDRVICLRQSPDTLFYRSFFPNVPTSRSEDALRDAETLKWLKDYFQLDIDLVKLYDQWSDRDPVFRTFKTRFEGIRILRQDPWENLVSCVFLWHITFRPLSDIVSSFICSSNNNIPRITKMVQSLCKQYSPPLLSLPPSSLVSSPSETSPSENEMQTYHPFPPPSVLALDGVSTTLRTLGFGYRAEFIQRTAKMLVDTHGVVRGPHDIYEASEEWLLTLRNITTAEAREKLLTFIGVGRKVADCVLLMSLDKVWHQRLSHFFPI
jgi:N-glycosylase/DNA lyase